MKRTQSYCTGWRRFWSRLLPATKHDLKELETQIMAKLSTLKDQVELVNARLEKVRLEVQALKDSLGDVEIPADAQAALDALSGLVGAIDDINPDAEPPPA